MFWYNWYHCVNFYQYNHIIFWRKSDITSTRKPATSFARNQNIFQNCWFTVPYNMFPHVSGQFYIMWSRDLGDDKLYTNQHTIFWRKSDITCTRKPATPFTRNQNIFSKMFACSTTQYVPTCIGSILCNVKSWPCWWKVISKSTYHFLAKKWHYVYT